MNVTQILNQFFTVVLMSQPSKKSNVRDSNLPEVLILSVLTSSGRKVAVRGRSVVFSLMSSSAWSPTGFIIFSSQTGSSTST